MVNDATLTRDSITQQPAWQHRRQWLITLAAFSCFLVLILFVQRQAGGPSAAFGGFPDESAHYVGGLAMHDYMTLGLSQNPLRFLKDYHLRLPFFALGVWPPFFYFVEGVWMGIFGVSRTSILWMIALSAAGLATLLFYLVRIRFGPWMAAAAGAGFLLIPAVQWSACLVMVDITCSLLALAAIVFFARFVERGRWQDSAWFGVLAGLSLLTKNSTYFLVLIPPIVIAFTWRWDLLRSRALWIAPVVVVVLYAPWLIVSRPFLLLGTHGLQLPGFWGIQRDYIQILWRQMSFLLPVGAAGAVLLIISRQKMSALAICLLAALPAVSIGIFLARVPVQDRLLMVSYCALLFFVPELFSTLLRSAWRTPVVVACIAVFGYFNWLNFRRPPADDIRPAVTYILAHDDSRPGAVLLPSSNEGPWIAEFGELDSHRPYRMMLRPTKMLGAEDWNGTNWHAYYPSLEDIQRFLERTPVRYCILVQPAQPAPSDFRIYPHDTLLEAAVSSNPMQWRLVFEKRAENGAFNRVYQNLSWTPESEKKVYAEVSRIWTQYLP